MQSHALSSAAGLPAVRQSILVGWIVVFAFALESSTAAAAPFYVRARTTAAASGFLVVNPYNATSDTGEVPLVAIAAKNLSGSISSPSDSASGSSNASAEIGALHASASFTANSNPGGNLLGATASAQAWWGDTLTISSTTLALGTPVLFQATISFHRVISGYQGNVTASVSGPFGLTISDSLAHPNPVQSVSTIVQSTVGAEIAISSTLSVNVNGSIGPGQNANGSIDAFNTALFTFTPVTTGASYTTASGVQFVPEPSTYVLTAMGLIGLLAFRRRKAAA